ncbi:MAG: enoyl-CoA hydratase [Lautropia sp.]
MHPPRTPPPLNAHVDAAGVATLSIEGARSLNIVGSAAIDAATQAIRALAGDERTRVLVLRGRDPTHFVGGADIDEMVALTPPDAEAFIRRLAGLCDAVRDLPVPVIARLSGWCLGGGLELAMACDLRLSTPQARFGMPEVCVGIPSVIHASLLPLLVGRSRATWMLMTGEAIDATTAQDWGLVHRVVDESALDVEIDALASRLAAMGPTVLAAQKALLRAWEGVPVDQAIEASVPVFARAFESEEPRRFMSAFLARRRGGAGGASRS